MSDDTPSCSLLAAIPVAALVLTVLPDRLESVFLALVVWLVGVVFGWPLRNENEWLLLGFTAVSQVTIIALVRLLFVVTAGG